MEEKTILESENIINNILSDIQKISLLEKKQSITIDLLKIMNNTKDYFGVCFKYIVNRFRDLGYNLKYTKKVDDYNFEIDEFNLIISWDKEFSDKESGKTIIYAHIYDRKYREFYNRNIKALRLNHKLLIINNN